jgi:PIN domain nuclease of toxin-antitoxin system
VRLLLDTHALIWWLAGDPLLSANAKAAVLDPANEVFVSAASAWEIATKFRIGKLPHAGALAGNVRDALANQGFLELPITLQHGRREIFPVLIVIRSTVC